MLPPGHVVDGCPPCAPFAHASMPAEPGCLTQQPHCIALLSQILSCGRLSHEQVKVDWSSGLVIWVEATQLCSMTN